VRISQVVGWDCFVVEKIAVNGSIEQVALKQRISVAVETVISQ